MKLYHASDRSNLDSILQKGILRGDGSSFVSLSEDCDSWVEPEGNDGKVVFEVDADSLHGRMNTFLPELDEVIYWGDVPPESIIRWKIGNIGNPCHGWVSAKGED